MVENLPAVQETQVQSLGWEDPWRRKWQPTPVFLPGEFHGQRNSFQYFEVCKTYLENLLLWKMCVLSLSVMSDFLQPYEL